MKVAVTLDSRVNSFSMTQYIAKQIQAKFPDWTVDSPGTYRILKESIDQYDIIVSWKFLAEDYSSKQLKAVFTPAAGKDWVTEPDDPKISTTFGSFHGPMIAESFLSMMLQLNSQQQALSDGQNNKKWFRNFNTPRSLLSDQHLMIVGYGKIGFHCAKLAKAFGMTITGVGRSDKPDDELGTKILTFDSIENELEKVDHLLVLLPKHESTNGMIDQKIFNKLKSTAFVYNFGRGTAINEEDLIEALISKAIAGAGLDVFETEPLPDESDLWDMSNVLISSHNSCCYENYKTLYATELLKNLIKIERP